MNPLPLTPYTQHLQHLMQQAGISSFKQLSRHAAISERQLNHLRQGQVSQMRIETVLKLSEVLQVPVSQLISLFSAESIPPPVSEPNPIALKQDYQRLQQQLEHQRQTLMAEFQQSSLQMLESLLLQWPTAAYAAQQNEQLPAIKLLPLIKPIERLLQQWGIDAIASVGEEVAYDPQWHQLMSGTAKPGDPVRVRYIGYRQGDKLLYRAKVSQASSSFS